MGILSQFISALNSSQIKFNQHFSGLGLGACIYDMIPQICEPAHFQRYRHFRKKA